jgi:hypothetical protein
LKTAKGHNIHTKSQSKDTVVTGDAFTEDAQVINLLSLEGKEDKICGFKQARHPSLRIAENRDSINRDYIFTTCHLYGTFLLKSQQNIIH